MGRREMQRPFYVYMLFMYICSSKLRRFIKNGLVRWLL